MIKSITATLLLSLSLSQNINAASFTSGEFTAGKRADFGYGADGGNLEMYSTDEAGRAGELRFVYGGSKDGVGSIRYIHHSTSEGYKPVLYLDSNGVVVINNGVTVPCADCKLAVNGKIQAKEIQVLNTGWADYVFKEDYKLMALKDVETFIDTNGHLPGVPSASDVAKDGVDIGGMTKTLLEKVEELTLHMIKLQKENLVLKEKMATLTVQK